MENQTTSCPVETKQFVSNLGTFEGFNFRSQSAIERVLTAAEVVGWDHDRLGEAEFWPSGDRVEVAVIFTGRNAVTASELLDLDRLLIDLGGDSTDNFLRIHYATNVCGTSLEGLSAEQVEDHFLHVFVGNSFIDLRSAAAYELFDLYHPDAYLAWERSNCDGLIFDVDRFLDSPSFYVEEIALGNQKALLIAPQ